MRTGILAIIFAVFSFEVSAQVNMQTGAAEQSFPLINYLDSKAGLTFGVGLAYSSGNGLLVNDIASDVGTGWNIDAGGVIMRVQNGEPDDQPQRNINYYWSETSNPNWVNEILKNYPNGYMYNANVGKGCNVGLNYYPAFKHQTVYKELNVVAGDTEQDKFIFRMNGRSGVFVIGRDWKVTTIGDSRMKISFNTSDMTEQGIRTTIHKFVITTEDGIRYTFQEKGLSRLARYKYSARSGNGNWYPINGNPDDGSYAVNRFWGYEMGMEERPFIVNSWFLSEIENTNTGQKILFNYQSVYNNVVASKIVSHQRDLNNSCPGGDCGNNNKQKKKGREWYAYLSSGNNALNYSWNTSLLGQLKAGATSLIYNRSITQSKRLSSITLPNGGTISFGYSAVGRADLPGEHAMETISYQLNGRLIRSYKMTYGYFYMNSVRPYYSSYSSFESKFLRLCLLSVQKIGEDGKSTLEPPYRFEYYTGSTKSSDDFVPARNYLSQDHWGYYNGHNAALSLTEDHDFLAGERDAYFKTVLPRYKNAKYGYAKNGLLKSVTYPTGGTIEYTYDQNKPSQNILPAGNEQISGGVSVSKVVLYDGEDHLKDIVKEYFYRNAGGVNSRWGDESPSYHSFNITEYNLKCFSGKRFKYPGLSYAEMATSLDWGKVLGKALLSAAVGVAVQYGIGAALTAIGAGAAVPFVNIAIFVASIVKIVIECTKTYEYHRYILGNTNNIAQNPLAASYTAVEVRSNSPTGYNGKTVYEFTGPGDYPVLIPKLEWPYIQSQRLLSWAYGLPKKVTVYDKDNRLVNESSSIYNFIASKLNSNNNNLNCKCATINKEAITAYDWDEYEKAWFTWGNHRWMWPNPYFITTGRTDLASTEEKSYSNGVLFASNATSVITDPMTLLQKGKIVQKDVNSLVIQLTYFPTDFNIPGSALEKLKEINAVHTPVSTETWMLKFNSQPPLISIELLNATVTEYKQYTFGSRQEVKPWKSWQLKSKTPVASSVIGTHNPSVLLRVPSLFKLQSEMVYDNDGNLVQTNTNDNVTSFVNDYSDRYVVASVANAAYTDIAYTSFEANRTGGWIFNSSSINTSVGLTGEKSFVLDGANTVTRSGLNTGRSYVITYWVKDDKTSPILVNGSAGELLFEANHWQLYRHEVTGAGSVTVSGGGKVDEVRLYPKGALMSTVTYKEGIGKVSDCDANNRLLFYEYDQLGRLSIIRDQNRNIIKTYEYNYKQ
ncbi:MAG: hypothetical protein JNM88_13575 [Chitinophagaceae bacterium]|nr:hypothetical protein [Chitinophagaceae bacterium]